MRTIKTLIAAFTLLALTPALHAQGHGGQQRGGTQQNMHQDMRKAEQQGMNQSGHSSMMMQTDRHMRSHRMGDADVYGGQMMSSRERDEYRRSLQAAKSDKEWAEMRQKHQEEMQARAKERGIVMDPPVYGQHMLTSEERQRFATRMQSALNDAERNEIRMEHRKMVMDRARELGIPPPDDG